MSHTADDLTLQLYMAARRRQLIQRMATDRALYTAWGKVVRGTDMPGADGLTPGRFADQLTVHIARLREDLLSAAYRPGPLRTFMRRTGRKDRLFAIPTVRDRVAQRAALDVLAPHLDGEQSASSFAYRRGRSWMDALEEAARCGAFGLRWVVRFDIADYFASIDHGLLRAQLGRLFDEQRVVELLMGWVAAPQIGAEGYVHPTTGIPLGAAISASLANHHLAGFDRTVAEAHGRLVRYADDGAVFCLSPESARQCLLDVEGELGHLRLRVNPAKTYVSSFDRGFGLLGYVFYGDRAYPEDTSDTWLFPAVVQ